jgi:hypothetical protein
VIAIRPIMNVSLTYDHRSSTVRTRADPPRPRAARGLERGRRVSDELVRLTVVGSEQDAALLVGYLEAQGIEAIYDNRGSSQPVGGLGTPYAGEHEILVRAGDLEDAQAALEALPT